MDYAGPLLALALVIVCAHLGGVAFAAMRQPRVIGEIVAGLALGPSVLGAVAPGATAWLAQPFLEAVGQLALVLFMLIVGLEVDVRAVRRQRRLVAGVAAGSVVTPLVLGVGLGLALRPDPAFALFVGLALAVTALPVLARILSESTLAGSGLATVALACAAVNDLAAWLGLAAVSALLGGGGPWGAIAGVSALVAALLVARPWLERVAPERRLPLLVAAALAAAALTDALGLHLVIGPFLVGLCAPRDVDLHPRLEPVAAAVLPAFFFTAGLGVELGGLGADGLALLALTLVLAFAGKFVGTVVPARRLGLATVDALRLGALLNTRGLTQLVLLSAGRELGLLGPRMYAVLVLCALVTTAATGPLLRTLDRYRTFEGTAAVQRL